MKKTQLFFSAAAIACLAACQPASVPVAGPALDSLAGHDRLSERRLSTAAAEAIASGQTAEALALHRKLYAERPSDTEVVVNYAQLLRKTGDAKTANDVLSKAVRNIDRDKKTVPPVLLNEAAATGIALGNFDDAEKTLARVLEDTRAEEFHADAYNLMGVVLDSRGQFKEAEQMFRLALDSWRGNATPVMNNLALNLASQGMFDESLTTLRQALVMAPDKQEIARNIQIVGDLRAAVVPQAPVNIKKN